MDRIEAATLHLELYRIAAGRPGKGQRILDRVYAACEQFYEDDPSIFLLEQLRALQDLMAKWTDRNAVMSLAELKLHRQQLMQCIDEIVDLTGSFDMAAAVPLQPSFGNVYARVA